MLRIVCVTLSSIFFATLAATAQENPAIHPHEIMNTWGEWGKDDERGAANYISPERVAAAATLIQSGETFSLAIPISGDGPRIPTRRPPHHFMTNTGADALATPDPNSPFVAFPDDYIYMPLQGSTQWDALSHAHYGGKFYNNVPLSAVTNQGAEKLGVENVRESLVGRGVLIDIVAYKGGRPEPGYGITRADIEGALRKQNTTVQEGDIVLIRTGMVPLFYELSPAEQSRWFVRQTGIVKDVVPWIKAKKIAAMAADNLTLEQSPNADGRNYNLHGNILRDLGVYIGELWTLEELAAGCAEDGRYTFFLAAQPLHIPGAVGTPLNPIAIK